MADSTPTKNKLSGLYNLCAFVGICTIVGAAGYGVFRWGQSSKEAESQKNKIDSTIVDHMQLPVISPASGPTSAPTSRPN